MSNCSFYYNKMTFEGLKRYSQHKVIPNCIVIQQNGNLDKNHQDSSLYLNKISLIDF